MNPPKCQAEDYMQWLIASPKVISCTQAAKASQLAAHDAYTRLLERLEPDPDDLWLEVETFVDKQKGYLVGDDCTLDKPYGPHIELVCRHWSGKHRAVVNGINLITLLWTDGDIAIPIDWRVFNKAKDGLTKNDHLREMLKTAQQRGFKPQGILWDSWYSSLPNLKMVRGFEWPFFVGLKSNRQANPDGKGNRAVSELPWKENQMRAHLKGYGWVQLYRVVDIRNKKESIRYFASSDAGLDDAQVKQRRELGVQIEQYHRGLKQECNIERCQARKEVKQRNHIGLAIRAFVRLEVNSYRTGISRFEAKMGIIREAVRRYLEFPLYVLEKPTA